MRVDFCTDHERCTCGDDGLEQTIPETPKDDDRPIAQSLVARFKTGGDSTTSAHHASTKTKHESPKKGRSSGRHSKKSRKSKKGEHPAKKPKRQVRKDGGGDVTNIDCRSLSAVETSFMRTKLKWPFCISRLLELMACLAALVSYTWNILHYFQKLTLPVLVLFATPFAFGLIALHDLVVTCWFQRMRWHVWVITSISALIFYAMCLEFIYLLNAVLSSWMYIPYLVAACLYTFDIIYWYFRLMFEKPVLAPEIL